MKMIYFCSTCVLLSPFWQKMQTCWAARSNIKAKVRFILQLYCTFQQMAGFWVKCVFTRVDIEQSCLREPDLTELGCKYGTKEEKQMPWSKIIWSEIKPTLLLCHVTQICEQKECRLTCRSMQREHAHVSHHRRVIRFDVVDVSWNVNVIYKISAYCVQSMACFILYNINISHRSPEQDSIFFFFFLLINDFTPTAFYFEGNDNIEV